jgi:CheY-like chemotaxis protein
MVAHPDLEIFLQELHDALRHLYELPVRRTHPLCHRLETNEPVSPARLREILLNAIEGLRPPPHIATDTPRWRRYRYLYLRYVEGAPLEQVVADLGISDRQARREHRAALEALAAVLIQTRSASDQEPLVSTSGVSSPDEAIGTRYNTEPIRESPPMDLETELVSVGTDVQPVAITHVVKDATSLVSRFAASRGVSLAIEIPDGLPAVIGTPTILRQLLLNILSHLIVNSKNGHVLRVQGWASMAGIELLFRALRQDTQSATATEGINGHRNNSLAVAARLAESQEAVLSITALPDGTLTTRLILPSTTATHVLVVDDNPGVVHLFRRYLRGSGFRLIQARNGLSAFQLAHDLHPDVIVLDLMMPIQDGWDLLLLLQKDPITASIPVVACSILPERDLALSLGARDFVAKPVNPSLLLAALEPFRRASRAAEPRP